MALGSSNDIFTLLALTVFADKRVFSEEVETFVRVAKNLQPELGIEPKLSEPRLLLWFENNRDTINAFLHAPNFESQLKALLGRLAVLPDKRPILKAMVVIAKADKDLHVSEKALIALARRAWS